MDDSLSAVDAYVGKQILENCLLDGPLADKTRVLATHALHVLDKTDYIYVMENGMIVEQGTYQVRKMTYVDSTSINLVVQDLMRSSVFFARIMDEYGSLEKEKAKEIRDSRPDIKQVTNAKSSGNKKGAMTLMQAEERITGSVALSTYAKYLRFGGGIVWGPIILVLLILSQGAQGLSLFTL